MSTIQDIRNLELQITDIVDDYIKNFYNDDDVLGIECKRGNFSLVADSEDKITKGKNTESYKLKDLTRLDDSGNIEADYDAISKIANSWLFL